MMGTDLVLFTLAPPGFVTKGRKLLEVANGIAMLPGRCYNLLRKFWDKNTLEGSRNANAAFGQFPETSGQIL